MKNRLIAELIHSQDSQSTLARIFGSALATGSTVEDIMEWPRRIMAVPAEQVLSVAQAYVKLERSVTGYLERTTDAQAAQGRS